MGMVVCKRSRIRFLLFSKGLKSVSNHIKQMSLESLNSLDDGRVSMAFLHELKRAVADCMDRPGDKTAREVKVEHVGARR